MLETDAGDVGSGARGTGMAIVSAASAQSGKWSERRCSRRELLFMTAMGIRFQRIRGQERILPSVTLGLLPRRLACGWLHWLWALEIAWQLVVGLVEGKSRRALAGPDRSKSLLLRSARFVRGEGGSFGLGRSMTRIETIQRSWAARQAKGARSRGHIGMKQMEEMEGIVVKMWG